jgi:hypothetical protein
MAVKTIYTLQEPAYDEYLVGNAIHPLIKLYCKN